MINILLPSMGSSSFFQDSFFPKPLIEIGSSTMLELVKESFDSVENRQLIYVFSQEDCQQFHLDLSVKLLEESAVALAIKGQTQGALCTSLFCIDYIDNDAPLVISNSDQIIDVSFEKVIEQFDERDADAGVITFHSIHPRWSYILLDNAGNALEVAEKRPLSNNAIAGFYYYKHGHDFVEAAKRAILKQNHVNGMYYVSASLNELILMNKKIVTYEIDKSQYHSFYSPAKIREYEERLYK